jgi:hypothetical protein
MIRRPSNRNDWLKKSLFTGHGPKITLLQGRNLHKMLKEFINPYRAPGRLLKLYNSPVLRSHGLKTRLDLL